ncbi:MAG: putative MFS family arabinose efflux permease [Pseudohongiellaceae bacterium]|jgi:predicted MFS family arabinose efflux permease
MKTTTSKLADCKQSLQQYIFITANYWAFTLTDGALRMLVVLHFHQLGYSALEIAFLFLFYEFFGVVTNLFGGWLGARFGLNRTMHAGLMLQVAALVMLVVPPELLTITWVMAAQALSGIAKDLNKMSAKSAIKLLVNKNAQGKLYQWIAILTGSKNSLKGLGFFLGAALLAAFEFRTAILMMAIALMMVCIASLFLLKQDLGKTTYKPKFKDIFSTSRTVNLLSAARLFLFSSRDVWFAVALPVYLSQTLQWSHWQVGIFIASWIIGYGLVQGFAPLITRNNQSKGSNSQSTDTSPDGKTAFNWACVLFITPLLLAGGLQFQISSELILITGLFLFGFVFAINSSLHSYLIIRYAKEDGVSLDVGFYYMANAIGRLMGTLLSGYVFVHHGFVSCLMISGFFIALSAIISLALARHHTHQQSD